MNAYLSKVYYNPKNEAGFASVDKLYKIKEQFPDVTRRQVIDWLAKQRTYTLHKSVRHRFKRNRIIVSYVDEQWQLDLTSMASVASSNSGNKYILVAIDLLSKYAWANPIKNKLPTTIINVMKNIFRSRIPT